MDNLSDVMNFYNHNLENEHTRLERHQLERDLTWRYLKRYLPKQGSILEVGCATGNYTLELAPAISADDESYNSLEGLQRERWLNLFEEISTHESIIGTSRHLLYIGSK